MTQKELVQRKSPQKISFSQFIEHYGLLPDSLQIVLANDGSNECLKTRRAKRLRMGEA